MGSAVSLIARKIFGSKNDREIKRMGPDVARINELEPEIQQKSDDELRAKIAEWKAAISAIEDREERESAMEEFLPEVFAVVREAAKRAIGQRHFDVQLIGGMVLHHGRIAEMKTGEGKTLAATLPAVLNSLSRARRARRDGQRLPGPARLRMDGADLQVPGPERRRSRARHRPTSSARPPTIPTSPTARTTSSASTICATT